jgi:hypothetical protein
MGGCGGCDTPPENKLSANEGICRQTKNNIPQNVKLNQFFGQYSLHSGAILAYNKEKWDKFCQFCEKLCYFVISGKFVLCLEKFWCVRKIFGPLKWYTDRNFFGDGGGGEVVKNNFLRKKIFGTKGTNNLQVFNHLNSAALHYGHPLTTWFVGKFYTHTPPV